MTGSQQPQLQFDIVICMDNALPHMLTKSALAAAIGSIANQQIRLRIQSNAQRCADKPAGGQRLQGSGMEVPRRNRILSADRDRKEITAHPSSPNIVPHPGNAPSLRRSGEERGFVTDRQRTTGEAPGSSGRLSCETQYTMRAAKHTPAAPRPSTRQPPSSRAPRSSSTSPSRASLL